MTAMGSIRPGLTGQGNGPLSVAVGYETGLVIETIEGGVIVERAGTSNFAQVALTCLLRPEPGDLVLTAAADGLWVIALLTRAAATPLQLIAPGDLTIGSATGTLSLSAPAGLRASTQGAMVLNAEAMTVQAGKATLLLDEVLHIGRSLTAHLPSMKIIGGLIETLAERVLLQAKQCFRVIEDSDHLRAATIDHNASKSLHLQAENAFVTAGNAIRMDAAQIHMG